VERLLYYERRPKTFKDKPVVDDSHAGQFALSSNIEGGQMPKIAILMGVYHEAARIGATLEAHLPYVNAAFVVHDGPCMDESLSIASRLGANTFETLRREGYGDPVFDLARQRALANGYDWGLLLAPDQRYTPALLKQMRGLILECIEKGLVGVYMKVRTLLNAKLVREDDQVRIIQLNKTRWYCVIHAGLDLVDPCLDITHKSERLHLRHDTLPLEQEKKERYLAVAKLQYKRYPEWRDHLSHVIQETEATLCE